MSSFFFLFFYCLFGDVAFFECPISLSFPLCIGEYLIRFPSGWCFCLGDHGLDFDISLYDYSINQSINQSMSNCYGALHCAMCGAMYCMVQCMVWIQGRTLKGLSWSYSTINTVQTSGSNQMLRKTGSLLCFTVY